MLFEQGPDARLNIKMLTYQYRDSHYKYKAVSQPCYLYNRNAHTWKESLYIEIVPTVLMSSNEESHSLKKQSQRETW